MMRPMPGRLPVRAPTPSANPSPVPEPATGLRRVRGLVRRVHVVETLDDVAPSETHPLVQALRERWPSATVVEAICRAEEGSSDDV